MDDLCEDCLSCGMQIAAKHAETVPGLTPETRIPLCVTCLEFPYRCDLSAVFERAQQFDHLPNTKNAALLAIAENTARRYQNPTPVIIGLILLELNRHGGVLLAGRRAATMHEYPDQLALVGGYVEQRHGGWRGALHAEAKEELQVTLDTSNDDTVWAERFESAGQGRLMLNWAVVLPDAVLDVAPFKPNQETSERLELPFTWERLPEFGIPYHNQILATFVALAGPDCDASTLM